ncbi:MAG: hypothetical protein KKF44_04720 [Nanoarchaeota archaeon]|nr:hypothetical protein [Nanoarchaeota archaeon]
MIPFIIIAILCLLIIGVILAVPAFKLKAKMYKKTGKYPKGHYMGQGITIGMPIGIAFGLAMDNIALGPAIGAAIGVAIGAGLEEKNKDMLRALTKEEEKMKQRKMYFLLAILLLGMAVFVATFFFVKKP